MWILGLAGSHNGAAALIEDGRVVVAVQAERLTRRKRQSFRLENMGSEVAALIKYCLDYAGIELGEVAQIATCTPWPQIHASFDEQARQRLCGPGGSMPPFLSVPHHLAHAEYVVHYCPLDRALVLICDGSGTFEDLRGELDLEEVVSQDVEIVRNGAAYDRKESISAYAFEDGDMRLIFRLWSGPAETMRAAMDMPRLSLSFGHLWRWAARYCFGRSDYAGKVMGLAPYGEPDAHRDLHCLSARFGEEVRIDFSGLAERFRKPNRERRDVTGEQHYADVSAFVQRETNRFLMELIERLRERFPTEDLCYSGGVALNSVANDIVSRSLGVNLHVNGSCEDNGTAIGAALAVYHHATSKRPREPVTDYYGREPTADEIEAALDEAGCVYRRLERRELMEATVDELVGGKVVGWFQGRSEFGPRALGNRSILADPRRHDIKDVLNRKVKFREAFRPFAPAVLADRAEEFFDLGGVPSPLMLRVVPVRGDGLPGVTHVDRSARVQTVDPSQNERFYELISAFGARTGVPVLVNTSFNVAGEPIVETPADAIRTFRRSGMDVLVVGHAMVRKPST